MYKNAPCFFTTFCVASYNSVSSLLLFSIRLHKQTLELQNAVMSLWTLDSLKLLPLETVYGYALAYVVNREKRQEANRKYRTTDRFRYLQRKYYYQKHDIYCPGLNDSGKIEKRWKRPATEQVTQTQST